MSGRPDYDRACADAILGALPFNPKNRVVPVIAVSAEEFASSPDYCDIAITPPQRALIQLAEGLPVTCLPDPEDMLYHCGARVLPPPTRFPRVVVTRAGRRSGKSLLAIIIGLIRKALTLSLRRDPGPGETPERDGKVGVRAGEPVRGLIVAPRVRQAAITFKQLVGILKASPKLSHYVVKDADESLVLRRDDGQLVTIEVMAASPKGTTLRGGWFIGVVFDEADYFGEEDASITLEDQMQAVKPALIPGAQMWPVSSPWDDTGHFAESHERAFGKPGDTVAFHSSSQRMNPVHCRPDEIEEDRKVDPEYVSREFDAEPMASSSLAYFPAAAIALTCVQRPEPFYLPPNGAPHWAGVDMGVTKNHAALALARYAGGKAVLAYYEEWKPQKGEPLSPSAVAKSFGEACVRYGANAMRGDSFYKHTVLDEFRRIRQQTGRIMHYDDVDTKGEPMALIFMEFRRRMLEGLVELPADPWIVRQLKDTKMKKSPSGANVPVLPKHGNAHADLLMAIVLAVTQVSVTAGSRRPFSVPDGFVL